MSDMNDRLQGRLRQELDEVLFASLELSEQTKGEIRKRAATANASRRRIFPKSWMTGAASAAAVILIIAGCLIFGQPNVPAPGGNPSGSVTPGGVSGTELSQLITTPLSTAEEAKAAFGAGLLIPRVLPEGYALSEIASTGMKDQPVRDMVFTYTSGEKAITFMASRAAASFPADLFTATKVNGEDGFVFEQETFTELYWTENGIQFAVTGPISAEEAMRVAESVSD
ncbi:DUF4367 domain-containing protein [Paenibacillus sp. R14(2021)]|uniref:DUF4367 domain-containing protein n=1 Tax=Paenibacillus sp. R14(2021) TaxID=2859228 RepID=UPI001C611CDB|nr:DUF4367 domain-containing protein [Paenibacillus sp. R14(2021)]